MNNRNQIPTVVVNLHVKYFRDAGKHKAGDEVLIPCYSFEECMQHEQGLVAVAEYKRVPLDTWKSIGQVSHDIISKMGDLCRETE